MPHKHSSSKRHHIGKMKFKITNWREYEAGLRRRGSLTFWMTDEALAAWRAPRRKTRGGQARYSDLAIETALTLASVMHQPLRGVGARVVFRAESGL
jgi:heme-degrading monooxygenase HmoA